MCNSIRLETIGKEWHCCMVGYVNEDNVEMII